MAAGPQNRTSPTNEVELNIKYRARRLLGLAEKRRLLV